MKTTHNILNNKKQPVILNFCPKLANYRKKCCWKFAIPNRGLIFHRIFNYKNRWKKFVYFINNSYWVTITSYLYYHYLSIWHVSSRYLELHKIFATRKTHILRLCHFKSFAVSYFQTNSFTKCSRVVFSVASFNFIRFSLQEPK